MKKEIRQRLRALLATLSEEQLRVKSAAITGHVLQLPEFIKADVVMAFLSLPHEVDTAAIILAAWQTGKRVVVPKVSIEQHTMWPIEIHSITRDLELSNLGIREPISHEPMPIERIDLVLVPGLGFDQKGNRLGRGRGYYDRFLCAPEFRGIACGLAFTEQLLAAVPVDERDHLLSMLVTDEAVYRFTDPMADRYIVS